VDGDEVYRIAGRPMPTHPRAEPVAIAPVRSGQRTPDVVPAGASGATQVDPSPITRPLSAATPDD
jgi:hypothetical protein